MIFLSEILYLYAFLAFLKILFHRLNFSKKFLKFFLNFLLQIPN